MKKSLLAFSVFALPAVVGAQELTDIKELVRSIGGIIELLIPLVFALAVLYFFWGIANYIMSPDKEKAKNTMIWGVVALFVMASVWGIVSFIQKNLGINDTVNAPVIDVPNADGTFR